MLSKYYTIKCDGFHEITIQKSRFIGYVTRVHDEEEAQQFIQRIKKKHHDATHNCSAYIIGDNDEIQKANDDGEPSGTAGIPMLEVLKKLQLKNTAVVVTRYFGGIKLGAGGLIRAYSSTTSETIKNVGIVERQLMQGMLVSFAYPLLGKIENELRNSEYIIDHIEYIEHINMNVFVHINQIQQFKDFIVNLSNNQVDIKDIEQKYIEVDV
ncbi:YigZ family protein [Pseudogracilibacillus sp. ICA-222130]|uniref:YigZ family protein n=1 Tax=Pseudogracilibacillus sp. ICA-222130 TaxID=3134655 RepID=UPI0030C02ABB